MEKKTKNNKKNRKNNSFYLEKSQKNIVELAHKLCMKDQWVHMELQKEIGVHKNDGEE
jgi:hypothetical protein